MSFNNLIVHAEEGIRVSPSSSQAWYGVFLLGIHEHVTTADGDGERTSSYALILSSDFQDARRQRSTGKELSGDGSNSSANLPITSAICCRDGYIPDTMRALHVKRLSPLYLQLVSDFPEVAWTWRQADSKAQ